MRAVRALRAVRAVRALRAVRAVRWIHREFRPRVACAACCLLRGTRWVGRYLEASVDVGSSMVASAIHGIILRGCASIIVVTGFTIEGQTPEELPERMLGAVRFQHIDVPNVVTDLRATF